MQSLKDKFENLRLRLGQDRGLDSTGTEPIYYLVFPVSDQASQRAADPSSGNRSRSASCSATEDRPLDT